MFRSIALAAALAFTAAPHAQAALQVVTSTSDFGALASAVGRDKVNVTVLAKPTDNPHAVEVKGGAAEALSHADVLIYAGADLEEGWLIPLVEASRNQKIAPGGPGRFEGRLGMQLIDEPESSRGMTSEQHPLGNPHFMVNPLAARKTAEAVTDLFCRLDAPSCDTYRANLVAFSDRFDKSLRTWMRLLNPYRMGTAIVSLHPSWNY